MHLPLPEEESILETTSVVKLTEHSMCAILYHEALRRSTFLRSQGLEWLAKPTRGAYCRPGSVVRVFTASSLIFVMAQGAGIIHSLTADESAKACSLSHRKNSALNCSTALGCSRELPCWRHKPYSEQEAESRYEQQCSPASPASCFWRSWCSTSRLDSSTLPVPSGVQQSTVVEP